MTVPTRAGATKIASYFVPRLHRRVKRLLMGDVAGAYAEGGLLPLEGEPNRQFRVSRGLVRESFRRREARGQISVQQGRGAFVRNARDCNILDPGVLAALLEKRASVLIRPSYFPGVQQRTAATLGIVERSAPVAVIRAVRGTVTRRQQRRRAIQTDCEQGDGDDAC